MQNTNVILDTSPLNSGSSIRGIGAYTRLLLEALQQITTLTVYPIGNTEQFQKKLRGPDQLDRKKTIVHYPFFDLFFPTLPLFRVLPTVVTVHDVIPLQFPNHYRPGKKGLFWSFIQTWGVQRAEAVITDSTASANSIEKYLHVSKEKLFTVPLAASPHLIPPQSAKQRQILADRHIDFPYVLYVGDINYNKNIPQLIKMVKHLPPAIHLICIGRNFVPQPIPEWKWIETQLALSDVHARVHFVTDIVADDTDTLATFYATAQAYVQPSLAEGFGLPVLEAMQCRCPVVSSNATSLPEVTGEHAVLVDPVAEQMAAAVCQVLEWSVTHRSDVTRQAFRWSQTFSWRRVAEETAHVYRQVIATRKQP